jgi:DNA invertase Pin-like site-specific DNA recombinase
MQFTNRLLLQILASVAEFEREMILERLLSGVHAA